MSKGGPHGICCFYALELDVIPVPLDLSQDQTSVILNIFDEQNP
jgi:hypothetical protein